MSIVPLTLSAQLNDFLRAVQAVRPSVAPESIKAHLTFAAEAGEYRMGPRMDFFSELRVWDAEAFLSYALAFRPLYRQRLGPVDIVVDSLIPLRS